MKIVNFKLSAYLISCILFYLIFWKQNLGVNILIFTIIISFLGHNSSASKVNKILFCYLWIASIFLFINDSLLSKITYFSSLILFIGSRDSNSQSLRYSFFNSFLNYFLIFKKSNLNSNITWLDKMKTSRFFYMFKLIVLPLILTIVFIKLYESANPDFANLVEGYYGRFNQLINHVSFASLFFFIWGVTVVSWVYFRHVNHRVVESEAKKKDFITRLNIKSSNKIKYHFSLIALKKEYKSAVILIVMLNFILLIVNIVDVKSVWLGFNYNKPEILSSFVHQGTYILIFTVLLSVSIIIYLFRKNINFYKQNKQLIYLVYIWIFQNVFMCISVIIRNSYYVSFYGLSYKRIGVFSFLLLTILLLFLMLKKIQLKYSVFNIFKLVSWGAFTFVLLMSTINWDVVITKYNTRNTQSVVDYNYLFSLSNVKRLPILKQKLKQSSSTKPYSSFYDEENSFIHHYQTNSWLSWNINDYLTYNDLDG